MHLKSILGGSWDLLGGLGPEMAPRAQNPLKNKDWLPFWEAKFEPKIDQNCFDYFGSTFGAIWYQLGPTLAPKPFQN